MESISFLLQTCKSSSGAADEISEKGIISDHPNYRWLTFNHLGLLILKKLMRVHDICWKIGNIKGLLPKIINFTHVDKRLLKEVIVFTINNIKDILRYGEKHPLQQLGIEILMFLALEADATESVGGIGGVLKELFNIFFNKGMLGNNKQVRTKAGETLTMMVLESKNNCLRILKLGALEKLVEALEDQLLRVLRVITSEEHKLQEAMVGLAVSVLVFLFPEESRLMFKKAGITEGEVVQILKKYMHPPFKVSRIRRFAIELAICMMRDKPKNVRVFRDLGMEKELEFVLETTAELDIFNIFSSTVGMSHHSTMIHSLVKTALGLQDGMKQHNAVFIKFITYVEIKIIL
ncbi:hypothetical protein TB1_008685 [Malus domestica]